MRPPYITRQRYRMLIVLTKATEPMTAIEVADEAQLSPDTVRISLPKLAEHGWLHAVPEKVRRGQARHYSIVPHVRGYIRTVILGEDG